MSCKLQNRYTRIAEYIAGDMNETEQTEFEAHLLECDDCFNQAQLLDRAILLIRTKGEGAFAPQYARDSWMARVRDVFERRRHFQLPRLVLAPLLLVLALVATFSYSYMYYHSDVKTTFEFNFSESFFQGVRGNADIAVDDRQQLNYLFSSAISSFVNDDYDKALSIFQNVQAQLQTLNLAEEEQLEWQYTIQLYLGASKVGLWQLQQPGYFEWLTLKMGLGDTDYTLLIEAKEYFSNAQQLSVSSQSDITPNQNLESIISSINARMNFN